MQSVPVSIGEVNGSAPLFSTNKRSNEAVFLSKKRVCDNAQQGAEHPVRGRVVDKTQCLWAVCAGAGDRTEARTRRRLHAAGKIFDKAGKDKK